MASKSNDIKDRRMMEFEDQPGMTRIKRPKLTSLIYDGAIDLKRVRHYSRGSSEFRPLWAHHHARLGPKGQT
jgi:hypothetical protein